MPNFTAQPRTKDATRIRWRASLLTLTMLVLTACATGESTRLRAEDMEDATQEMAQSLATSSFLVERTPESPPVYLVINKVENLTSDLIPPAEQWMLMARLESSLPIINLGKRKNVRFLLPPEQYDTLKRAGYTGVLDPKPPTATHVMSAVFRDSSRLVRDKESDSLVNRRANYYLMQYTIHNVQTRQIEWTGQFEFKREAKGLAVD